MQLINGFISIFQPLTLALIIGGVIAGIIFGAIPGLSAFTALAIMLPLTYGMEPVQGISFLMAVYVGGCSGGLVSAILLGIPGTPSSIATCFDGYPMAKRGESDRAMVLGIFYSLIGGIFGALCLSYMGPYIAKVALKFSAYEYTAVLMFALTTVSSLSSGNMVRGLLSCLTGISLAFVGIDALTAYTRYTFGAKQLANGFNLVPLMIGVFAVSQIIENAAKAFHTKKAGASGSIANEAATITQVPCKGLGISLKEFLYHLPNTIVCACLGLVIGILPGIGGNVSNLMAYSFMKKRSKHPEKFGTGIPEGIIASEVTNNATVGGALIILLTLGIPGDNATSMILAGFQLHTIAPGPLLFRTKAALVYALFAAFILSNIVMFISMFFGRRAFSKILDIPSTYLLPVVIAFCFVGSYAANNRTFDITVMVLFGIIGYIMKIFKLPLAPMVVGFILAPQLEEQLRRGLMRSRGQLAPFFASKIALAFFALTVVMIVFAIISETKEAKKKKAEAKA